MFRVKFRVTVKFRVEFRVKFRANFEVEVRPLPSQLPRAAGPPKPTDIRIQPCARVRCAGAAGASGFEDGKGQRSRVLARDRVNTSFRSPVARPSDSEPRCDLDSDTIPAPARQCQPQFVRPLARPCGLLETRNGVCKGFRLPLIYIIFIYFIVQFFSTVQPCSPQPPRITGMSVDGDWSTGLLDCCGGDGFGKSGDSAGNTTCT